MKTKVLTGAMFAASLFIISCSSSDKAESTEKVVTEQTANKTYTINAVESVIAWRGEVAGVYGHDGVIKITDGSVTTDGSTLSEGTINIDMSTIAATDSASYKDMDGGRITDLEGHLTTADFFNIAEFPSAAFEITSATETAVTGNLTIKGITHEETFVIASQTINDDSVLVAGTLTFDRQKYTVSWKHYMKDMVLSDDIKLTIEIAANN